MNRKQNSPILDIFIEFLEVAIHTILHARKLYPDSIYKCFRKYGIPIYISIHPQVNEYINECLRAARYLINDNQLRKLVICILSPDQNPIQRFVFDILRFLGTETGDDPYLVIGEQAFRAFCLRVAALEAETKPLPKGSTFTLQLLTSEASSISLSQTPEFQNFPWVEVDVSFGDMVSPEVIPIRTIQTEYLILQMYTEESIEEI